MAAEADIAAESKRAEQKQAATEQAVQTAKKDGRGGNRCDVVRIRVDKQRVDKQRCDQVMDALFGKLQSAQHKKGKRE